MKNDDKFKKRSKSILRVMMGRDSLTIPEITNHVDMSLPIVTSVIMELVRLGKLTEIKDLPAQSAGRPPVLYKLNPNAGYTIGVELGRIYTNFVMLDYTQTKVNEFHTESLLSKDLEQVVSRIDEVIINFLSEKGAQKDKLLGLGISIPGLVQGEKGISKTYLKLDEMTLREVLEKGLGIKVRIEHDVKSMTIGEMYYGDIKDAQNVLCINYGWGLGVGIITNGQIYYGNDGFAGEFGHIPLAPNDDLCYCGKQGCLETISSGRAITKRVIEKLSAGASSMILKSKKVPEEVDPIDILKAANKGDQFSIEILEEAGKYLGIGIAVLINLFNPGLIIIGGTISQVAGYLIDSLKNNAMKHSIVELNKNVVFKISDLKNNAASLGVARLTSIEYC